MNTNKNFIYRKIAGEAVLVPTGEATQNFNGMISLSETAAFIWKQVDTAKNIAEIADRLLDEYEVDKETAVKDTVGMLRSFYDHGLVENIPEFEKKN